MQKEGADDDLDFEQMITPTRGMKIMALPKDRKLRSKFLETCLSQPNIVSMDLSSCGVGKRDAKAIARGLARRALKDADGLRLLDLSGSDGINQRGMEDLLVHLSEGFEADDLKAHRDERTILPVTKHLVIRVGPKVDLTEELLTQWARRAPYALGSGMTIVETTES